MATFQGENWIEEQIKSIANQKDCKPTIFISDDNSTDKTVSIANQCRNKYKIKIEFISCKEKFFSFKSNSTKNFLRLISSLSDSKQFDYIAFSDQDDIWNEKHLTRAIEKLSTGIYDGYSSSIIAFWENGFEFFIKKTGKISNLNHLFESAGPGCTYVLTKSSFLLLQEFVINNFSKISSVSFHDWFIFAFLRSRGFKWIIDSFPSLRYRQHSHNVHGIPLNWKSIKLRFSNLYGMWFKREVLLLAEILDCNHNIIGRLRRFNLLDRLILFFTIGRHRRRLKEKVAIMFLPFFSK